MFDTILVAYDGSDHAQNALKTAAGLAKSQNAAVHLVHVPQIDSPGVVLGPFVSGVPASPTQAQIEEAGQKMVEKAQAEAEAEGVTLSKVHLGRGVPADFTLATAEKIGADLIVLGRRGLGSLGALALGSVSQSVAHGAKCACLTVV